MRTRTGRKRASLESARHTASEAASAVKRSSRKTVSSIGEGDDRRGKSMRRFPRKVVPDAARDVSVLIFAGEFLGVSSGIRVWRTIRVAFGTLMTGKPLFEIRI